MKQLAAYLADPTPENREKLATQLLSLCRAVLNVPSVGDFQGAPAGSCRACERETREEAASWAAMRCVALAPRYDQGKGSPEDYFGKITLRVYARMVARQAKRQAKDAEVAKRLQEEGGFDD